MATLTMSPNELLPAAKASGRCPPTLIRDEVIIEGGALIIIFVNNDLFNATLRNNSWAEVNEMIILLIKHLLL